MAGGWKRQVMRGFSWHVFEQLYLAGTGRDEWMRALDGQLTYRASLAQNEYVFLLKLLLFLPERWGPRFTLSAPRRMI